MRLFFIACFLGICSTICAQENYKFSNIELKSLINTDAVIRQHHLEIEVQEIDKVEITTSRIVTVLNEAGRAYIHANEHFDNNYHIQEQEAIILDAQGREIKKYKKRDFKQRSNFQDFILFSDNKISYLDYTPRSYPYTVVYTSRIRHGNTVFLPDWTPLEGYRVSVEKASYRFINKARIPLRFEERNLDGYDIKSNNSEYDLDYTVKDIQAESFEKFSPPFRDRKPKVLVALEEYALEGLEGRASNWENFGKWQYDHLVSKRGFLSDAIVSKISELTKNAVTVEEKARIIYQYVQDNTRYIAVMLGIGGWKPFSAEEVDRLGYGDCKGLTNYTRALLASQGIASDYTVIYGGPKMNIDPEFTKMQGNHVILSIPRENDEDIWLECTSQDIPFNYLGDFTDDRYAVKIKPEGGEIVRTRKYTTTENLQNTIAVIDLNSEGGFSANLERKSYGIPYGDIYLLEKQTKDVQKTYYRESWSHFQNLNFDDIIFRNDRRKIEFVENLKFEAGNFCSIAGERLLMPLSFIQGFDLSVEKDKNRKNDIIIKRGKTFEEVFKYNLPAGYEVEALPEDEQVETEFGSVSLKIAVENQEGKQQIIVRENLQLNEGEWSPEKFEDFRNFINKVHQLNSQRAVIAPIKKA